ncbi:MAG: LD-carboxypeptidase, partial [Alphaproteobacteria bacterium]|nr:LD-carboxypeptidase [Alphaproteobacteria bacterium]
KAAPEWSDDLWFLDQDNRQMIPNDGWWVLHEGNAQGVLEGGNLGTLMLLNATPYHLEFKKDTILMVEDCFTAAAADAKYFLRQLQSLVQRADFKNVRALLIGRFQKESNVSRDLLTHIVERIPQLKNIPVIANMDFGHTTPIATLPLGGKIEITETAAELSW